MPGTNTLAYENYGRKKFIVHPPGVSDEDEKSLHLRRKIPMTSLSDQRPFYRKVDDKDAGTNLIKLFTAVTYAFS